MQEPAHDRSTPVHTSKGQIVGVLLLVLPDRLRLNSATECRKSMVLMHPVPTLSTEYQ